jgi:hypothetical protein
MATSNDCHASHSRQVNAYDRWLEAIFTENNHYRPTGKLNLERKMGWSTTG